MRILVLTPSLPYPPHQGAAIRNYGIIHGLHEAGHRVTLLSFHDNSITVDSTPLANICDRIETVETPHRSTAQRLRNLLFSNLPDIAFRLSSDAFRARLETLLTKDQFDLVQFEGLEMANYASLVQRLQPSAKLCYDAHNAEYALQRIIYQVDRRKRKRWFAAAYSLIQSQRIARFERQFVQTVDCVIAVSGEDAAALRPFRSDEQVYVVPNGIFVTDYEADPQQLDLGENILIFTGKMDYRPNVDAMLWFTEHVLPLVQKEIPLTRLYIVGQKPHASLQELRSDSTIEITGWVRDVQPFLHAADVYVAPLRMGSGTRLKILEAMAAGCALVTTEIAASGLQSEMRAALVFADTADDMAQAIIDLLLDSNRRSELGAVAQRAVKKHYDWSALIPCLLAAYEDSGIG